MSFACGFMEFFYTSCKGEKRDNGLIDYKLYCFNGVPEYCQVITDRYSGEKIDFFDMNW